MADRLASLRRIEAVQKQMVRLSDWRLALAQQACRAAAIAKRDAEIGRRDALRLREAVVARMTEEAALDARRAEEDRDLKTTMEAWLVARDASLP